MGGWPPRGETIFLVTDGRGIPAQRGSTTSELGASIDELVDRAVSAINRGDPATATALAGQVLAIDHGNADAEDLLLVAPGADGEIRRLTILFADVVDSTVLSTRAEPEIYPADGGALPGHRFRHG